MTTPTAGGIPADRGPAVVLRISLPSQDWQKAVKAYTKESIWKLKQHIMEKMASGIEDALNYGIFVPADSKTGKQGKFLDEKRELGSFSPENNWLLEFVPKHRVWSSSAATDADAAPGSPSINSKKKQKKFFEDVQKGNIDKVKERGQRGIDPNFWSESGESPLSVAVMNNDKEMIGVLLENGAMSDYRLGKKDGWKTPLHLAALNNKVVALQTLISYGAWINCPDGVGLTPLYYATLHLHADAVLRLLVARADTEIFDESGKGPLHMACFHNHEAIASILIDLGANLNAPNAVGNTPLHVCATRDAKDCARWLLLRGCERELVNKSGQTAAQLAGLSGSSEIGDLIKKWTDAQVIPPPPKPVQPGEDLQHVLAAVPAIPRAGTSTHSRAASTDVNHDPRRVSMLPPGDTLPRSASKRESMLPGSTLSHVASGNSTPIAKRASTATGKKPRKSVFSGEKFIPPPPTSARPLSVVGGPVPGSTRPSSIGKENASKRTSLEAGVGHKVSETPRASVARPPDAHASAGTNTPANLSAQSSAGDVKAVLNGTAADNKAANRRSIMNFIPAPAGPPPAHLLGLAAGSKPAVPSPLQFAAPPPPKLAPPAPASLPPAPILPPGPHSRAASLDVLQEVEPASAVEKPEAPASDVPATDKSTTEYAAMRAQAQHIITMLQTALHGEEEHLEVDLEMLLDGFGALEKALVDTELKCRELELKLRQEGGAVS
ncbi:uncharacterized protein EV422DRAFT_514223 [Fimicolochytrium jonesii]|uniref:uncharacterized protein n=1 Tax=Fimicolochytrium jonesii TaxID=1396493 RepID=UPI0022FE574B|nr:uncharacterized protein EV422DRAFT_514223 [Fimicolochytrium jonesii]KAI8825808.1 hypothetical protein EV422DRAFT_514223 [Fimicolochytrium jonesii]